MAFVHVLPIKKKKHVIHNIDTNEKRLLAATHVLNPDFSSFLLAILVAIQP